MKKCFLRGSVELEIHGAACEMALNRLCRNKIPFWNVQRVDAFTVRICVFPADKKRVSCVITSSMCDVHAMEETSLKTSIKTIRKRIAFFLLIMLIAASAVVLPRFVLFYDVVGNETIPSDFILRELQKIGIGFGIYGPDIHPAWVKNNMIQAIPELQWLTITQNGCRAKVMVRERTSVPLVENRKGFSNVVAIEGGIITKMSVYAGQPVVEVGDTVEKGQLLVSGVVDLERIYVLENANAEIFARTWREIVAVIPENYAQKGKTLRSKTGFSIQIGQKRINLFGNSGIYHGSCDKMITRLDLTLPENLSIPISVEISKITWYEPEQRCMSPDAAEQLLTDYIEDRVCAKLRAGEILASTYRTEILDGRFQCNAVIECSDMIAERVAGKITFED